ncbi:MAG: hypothetical protein PVF73_13885 [Bacteroidales bacterium]|jgi:hypothetical protein
MINNFVIESHKEGNRLSVVLDGIFMKSEIELAIYLMKKEIRKLSPGFDVDIDIHNMDVNLSPHQLKVRKYRKILKLMGAGSVRFVGLSYLMAEPVHESGGDYSYENEWFF